MRLAVGGSSFGAGGDVRLLSLGLGAATGLVQGGSRDEVLHDGAVAGELERRSRSTIRGRLGDDSLQYGALHARLVSEIRACRSGFFSAYNDC